MRKKQVLGLLTVLIMITIVACASLWKEKTTATYESIGNVLASIQQGAKSTCDQGLIKPDDCVKLRDSYNKARQVYIVAGDTLIEAMNIEELYKETSDVIKKKELKEKMEILIKKYQGLILELNNLYKEYIDMATKMGVR